MQLSQNYFCEIMNKGEKVCQVKLNGLRQLLALFYY